MDLDFVDFSSWLEICSSVLSVDLDLLLTFVFLDFGDFFGSSDNDLVSFEGELGTSACCCFFFCIAAACILRNRSSVVIPAFLDFESS